MPKIAIAQAPNVAHARALLLAYLDRPGNSGMQLSRESGVPQYSISRFLTGRTRSVTSAIDKALIYATNGIDEGLDKLSSDPRIKRALSSAWDGTEEGTALLASAIDALAPVIRSARPK